MFLAGSADKAQTISGLQEVRRKPTSQKEGAQTMEKRKLDDAWLAAQTPLQRRLVADRSCPGLVARIGPRGTRFHVWQQGEKDEASGRRKRTQVDLGAIPLAEARGRALELLGRAAEKPERRSGPTVADIVPASSAPSSPARSEKRRSQSSRRMRSPACPRDSSSATGQRPRCGRELVVLVENAKGGAP